MYIVFHLPRGAGGQSANHALYEIKQEVQRWAEQYGIRYTQKTIKYDHRVAFDKDDYYTLFAMTWNPPKRFWFDYEIVNVAGERY